MSGDNKGKWLSIVIVVVLAILAVMVIFNVKQCNSNKEMYRQIVEMKHLQDGIVRSQAQYATKADIEQAAKNIEFDLNAVKKDLKNFGADVKGLSTLVATSLGKNQSNIPSSIIKPKPKDPENPDENPTHPHNCPTGESCADPFGHLTNSQTLTLTEPFSDGTEVPIGNVTFEVWKEKPWTTLQHQRNYNVTTVLGQDKEGRHYTYHKFEIETEGEKHTVPISKSEFLEEMPEASFSWWNPRVGIGMYSGISFNTSPADGESIIYASVTPNISASPFSYGKTETKPDWIFARVGIGYDVVSRAANFSVSPAMWNMGSEVKFIQNTYIGPVVGADTRGNVSVGAGFTTDF